MHVFFSTAHSLPLPEGHRFPKEKYGLLRARLISEEIIGQNELRPSPMATREDVLRVHSPEYVEGLEDGSIDPKVMRRIGFPWSSAIPTRGRVTVGGALAAARAALRDGISGQLAGGTHHAHRDFGSGFCIYNDLAVVAATLLDSGEVDRVAIVDGDVHQGDGNAALLRERQDVYILDLFGEKNFPFRKVPSHHDVSLPDQCEDDFYLSALVENLPAVWAFKPDILLYQAGVDPLMSDHLGRMQLSFEGLMKRDHIVLDGARQRGIPVSMAIGGGYAKPIEDTVVAYANTYVVAKQVFRV